MRYDGGVSELWERRMVTMVAFGLALFCIGAVYGALAALGVAMFGLAGYHLGAHERDGLH